ncbi:P-loop containing nucleoside triphosphate hydrolase protein [Ceraceosorus guamensis]|uniref:DNA 3'-5' helicase n=1 Tax=Ceraceosorus guamensis TaxID=1522189 RepID=A0A316VXG9_9BASI|nr:P-loop containing nucleoside triphosphate hydrolase protein [Ceraceosorus guamensis]PWN42347.1 P-loop containing nucleoside triphosphate hydrolase protein [Ceraceosorus guamensis]
MDDDNALYQSVEALLRPAEEDYSRPSTQPATQQQTRNFDFESDSAGGAPPHRAPLYFMSEYRGLQPAQQVPLRALSHVWSHSQPEGMDDLPQRSSPTPAFVFGAGPSIDPANLASTGFVEPRLEHSPQQHSIAGSGPKTDADIYRSLFQFPAFNAVQSTVFDTMLKSDDNCVVTAPTGAGKTAIFEFAIIRMLQNHGVNAKAVYVAPTKALCSERAADWAGRFAHANCTVAELTGDSGKGDLSITKRARVIVTTPEKWDSWQEGRAIFDKVKVLMIDEVHILRERQRGARVEVLVSRMKTYGNNVRIIALSATIPNASDIAQWLRSSGGSSKNGIELSDATVPSAAKLFEFGEEFRPCPLKKYIYAYPNPTGDLWSFNNTLNSKLLPLITEHARRRPALIFVATRKMTVQAAEAIAKEFKIQEERGEVTPWSRPSANQLSSYIDPQLHDLARVGIAVHHAGLDQQDRQAVERDFRSGAIGALCATSTLAVGVNLPAYLVIVKGTKKYDGSKMVDLTDFDLLQAIGRAGRPNYDREGVACILTEERERKRISELVQGGTNVESVLHHELIEHVNAELTLRERTEESAIQEWLESMFLFVRMQKNPSHYAVAGVTSGRAAFSEVKAAILSNALDKLQEHGYISREATSDCSGLICSTDLGNILSKYYLGLDTLHRLTRVPRNAKTGDILEAICQAEEWKELRFRSGEKAAWTKVKGHEAIRFPPAKITTAADKVTLIIQATLAGVTIAEAMECDKSERNHSFQDVHYVFERVPRILKALLDVALLNADGGTVKSAFELLRSVSGKAWDGTWATLRQLDGVGDKSARILADARLTDLTSVMDCTPDRIEILLNRKPPFGKKVIESAKALPRFAIHIELQEQSLKAVSGRGVCGSVSATVEQQQEECKGKRFGHTMFVVCLALTSDNELVDFRKMPVSKLSKTKTYSFKVTFTKPSQSLILIVGCSEVSGTAVRADVRPQGFSPQDFPGPALLYGNSPCEDPTVDEFMAETASGARSYTTSAGQARSIPTLSTAGCGRDDSTCIVEQRKEAHTHEKMPNGNYKISSMAGSPTAPAADCATRKKDDATALPPELDLSSKRSRQEAIDLLPSFRKKAKPASADIDQIGELRRGTSNQRDLGSEGQQDGRRARKRLVDLTWCDKEPDFGLRAKVNADSERRSLSPHLPDLVLPPRPEHKHQSEREQSNLNQAALDEYSEEYDELESGLDHHALDEIYDDMDELEPVRPSVEDSIPTEALDFGTGQAAPPMHNSEQDFDSFINQICVIDDSEEDELMEQPCSLPQQPHPLPVFRQSSSSPAAGPHHAEHASFVVQQSRVSSPRTHTGHPSAKDSARFEAQSGETGLLTESNNAFRSGEVSVPGPAAPDEDIVAVEEEDDLDAWLAEHTTISD